MSPVLYITFQQVEETIILRLKGPPCRYEFFSFRLPQKMCSTIFGEKITLGPSPTQQFCQVLLWMAPRVSREIMEMHLGEKSGYCIYIM